MAKVSPITVEFKTTPLPADLGRRVAEEIRASMSSRLGVAAESTFGEDVDRYGVEPDVTVYHLDSAAVAIRRALDELDAIRRLYGTKATVEAEAAARSALDHVNDADRCHRSDARAMADRWRDDNAAHRRRRVDLVNEIADARDLLRRLTAEAATAAKRGRREPSDAYREASAFLDREARS